jgi:hypothetical protein
VGGVPERFGGLRFAGPGAAGAGKEDAMRTAEVIGNVLGRGRG